MIDPTNPDYINTPASAQRPASGYRPADPTALPAATIVTPFYNTGPIFHETARSIFQQSLQQWEWLIINDGSTTPEALSTLECYRQGDPRVRVIDHADNKGLSAARNTGFRTARTPYVVQLDSDDLLEPTAVEKWLWFLESHPEFSFVKGYSVGFGAQEYLWQKGFHNGRDFLEENLVDPNSAVRTDIHQAVGGYDETDWGGLMDWDFWLRCAHSGYWGGTVPEYLDWYRRRPSHNDRWSDFDNGARQQAYRTRLREKYTSLWNGGFPDIQLRSHMPHDTVPDLLPWRNRLRKDSSRLLMIVPWLSLGGADKFNLDLVEQLTQRGWEVTIAATLKSDHSWLPAFARLTPDIFILHHFLRLVDYPRFLRYLIQSRQVDTVLIANSELGYSLLPYLRAYCPHVAFADFCHMEEECWKNGGYPRMAVEYQDLLDGTIVSSEHLRGWMAKRNADTERIHVCYTNIDPEKWRPLESERRAFVRQELRQEFGVEASLPMLVYAGRLCDQKQPKVFGHTLLRLRQENTCWVAVVAGDGPDLEWLQTFVKRQALGDHVYLLGALPNERIREVMASADVFFLPSQWEGIALSCYEAMACELPVVGADVGGQRELVTPECGVLIPRSNGEHEAERYAKVLAELLRDAPRRQRMGAAGRRRVCAHFQLEEMTNRMIELLQTTMDVHATQPRPAPRLSLGGTCANQAVENARLADALEQLWQEQKEERRWQKLAEERERLVLEQQEWINGREAMIREQQAWIAELEHGKQWLDEQRRRWQRAVEEQTQTIEEQQAWIAELEHGKQWLDEQRRFWQAQTRYWQDSLWGRLGRLLKIVSPAQAFPSTLRSEPDD